MGSISMRFFYAQSGGVTSVINATCAGLLHRASALNCEVLVGYNGIHALFDESFLSSTTMSSSDIEQLSRTPGGSFGSCRYKIKESDYPKILSFLKKHRIDVFTYHGGNDSMDTCAKIANLCYREGLTTQVIGLPKTIDNDLVGTDQCPGFGSAAKYLATSFNEACLDLTSMSQDSTKVFILETMGRHAGWLAASCGLGKHVLDSHLLLVPERSYRLDTLAGQIRECIERRGFCAIAISEGVKIFDGEQDCRIVSTDAFGHKQLGGVGLGLKRFVQEDLGLKAHVAIPDYLQRSAGHLISQTDFDQAWALGETLVDQAQNGLTAQMLTIKRLSNKPYEWAIGSIDLNDVANKERFLPDDYLNSQNQLTPKAKDYFLPLIEGTLAQKWSDGLPQYWPHRLHQQN